MGLTEEQNKQVARYVHGEMDTSEKAAFGLKLQQNSDLLEEVETYNAIRLLGESAGIKISALEQRLSEKKLAHEKVWRLIQQERANWEINAKADRKNWGSYNGEMPLIQRVSAKGKLRGINMWKWLAVATVAGFIALSAVWWHQHGVKKESGIVINPKEQESKPVTNNKQPDTAAGIIKENKAGYPKVHTPSDNIPSFPGITKQHRGKKEKAVRGKLVKSNFVPDSLPFQVPDALALASACYKEQKYTEAVKEYKRIIETDKAIREDLEVTIRSKNMEKELIKFYARYYLAQSYFSINHTQAAITELEFAMEESPSIYWKSKAQWYLALAYLKIGKIERTTSLLEQVEHNDPSGAYQEKAIQLSWKMKIL
jgi:tetratricopeptide (TPR) repeat protein